MGERTTHNTNYLDLFKLLEADGEKGKVDFETVTLKQLQEFIAEYTQLQLSEEILWRIGLDQLQIYRAYIKRKNLLPILFIGKNDDLKNKDNILDAETTIEVARAHYIRPDRIVPIGLRMAWIGKDSNGTERALGMKYDLNMKQVWGVDVSLNDTEVESLELYGRRERENLATIPPHHIYGGTSGVITRKMVQIATGAIPGRAIRAESFDGHSFITGNYIGFQGKYGFNTIYQDDSIVVTFKSPTNQFTVNFPRSL